MLEGLSQSFVNFNWWGLVETVGNLLVTFLILKKFLFKPVHKMLAERENEVKTMYAQAQEAAQHAEQMKTEYTERLLDAKEEAAEIVNRATRQATRRSEEIIKDSTQQVAGMVRRAEETIEHERKKTMQQAKDEIVDISVMIASKVLERDIKEEDHERLIEEFIDKIG